MVEGTGLENRRTSNGTVSSNLTLSVLSQDRFPGWVAEWFKAHAWKACGVARLSRVRISPHPLAP